MKHFFPLLLLCAVCAMTSCDRMSEYQKADYAIIQAMEDSLIPGAVLYFVDHDRVVYKNAYGYRSLVPEMERMTLSTVFDLASVSKPTGAGSAALMLIQRGLLLADDPVSEYLPDYEGDITIRHLMEHTSGLPAYLNARILDSVYTARMEGLTEGGEGYLTRSQFLIDTICHCPRYNAPGEKYRYSCLNFITLQNVVEAITGEDINVWMRRELYGPIGTKMGWMPLDNRISEKVIAPTERIRADVDSCFCGQVHDPLARIMNEGVSGNAGVFATGKDLAAWCHWFMNLPDSVREQACNCGLWEDEDGSLNHTGYTGTSIRIYPREKTAIILLTNRVHPTDDGNLRELRYAVYDALHPIQPNMD